MGYGGVTFPSTVLNYVNMPVITNEECNATFTGVITESNLCTSTVDGRSTCQGDAGESKQFLKFSRKIKI